jgi:hypothetical protein
VSEDAAAAARRIVAEVLREHGQDQVEAPTVDASEVDAGRSDAPRAGADAPDRAGDDRVAVPVDDTEPTPMATEPSSAPGPRPGDTAAPSSDARAIARRIVEQVLAEAEAAPTVSDAATGRQVSEDEPTVAVPAPTIEARVEDVPAEGVPAQEDTTVDVEVVAEVPDEGSLSAAEIVRRIVADVTAGATAGDATAPPGDTPATAGDAPAPTADTPAPTADTAATSGDTLATGAPAERDATVDEDEDEDPPPPPPRRSEPTRELDPRGDVPSAGGAGSLETEPTREVPARGNPGEYEPTREVAIQTERPREDDAEPRSGGVTLLDVPAPPAEPEASTPEASYEPAPVEEPGFEAVVTAPPPERFEPLAAPVDPPVDREAKPHTLRWLLTSIVGAIALAVLLPMAVGALRSLVSLS